MNYAPRHSWDHADSECVLYAGTDCKGAEFISNKLTNKHADTQLYILLLIFDEYLFQKHTTALVLMACFWVS